MIEEIYALGVQKRLRDLGVTKEAGAKHLALGALGAILGAGVGSVAAPALMDEPKGILGLPPTKGQLEHSLKQKAGLGTLIGGAAGAGLGLATPKIIALLKKIRGKQVKDILGPPKTFWS